MNSELRDNDERMEIDVDATVEIADTRVQEVTIIELGRLVLMEYTKKEFWVSFIERVGGIESLLIGGLKKIL